MEKQIFEIYSQKNVVVDEAYSFLKANFNFSNETSKAQSLSIVSSIPKEGKTTIAINLAIKFAQSGTKVLLVDADLRKPQNAKRLESEESLGLTKLLVNNLKVESTVLKTNIENLNYLSCGDRMSNPAALLSSVMFTDFLEKAKELFDLIIFDTPSLSSVIDGTIIASKTDSVVLVVKCGEVAIPKLKRVREQLEKANANVLGVILNNVNAKEYRKYFQAYDYFTDTTKFRKYKRNA